MGERNKGGKEEKKKPQEERCEEGNKDRKKRLYGE